MKSIIKFDDLGLSETTLKAIKKKGFEEPTAIQEKTIPLFLTTDYDLIGLAQTGTGKTAAFGLPIIETIKERSKTVSAIILAPTRELAIQVSEELNSIKGNKKLNIIPIYGGQSIDQQFQKLRRGADIVVGTPGRIIDHIKRKTLNLQNISHVVLDEADEMLNMGFIDEVKSILDNANSNRRTLLFSATMPKEVLSIAKNYMKEYKTISVKSTELTTNLTDQIYFEVRQSDKFEALCRIIDIEKDFYGLIFTRTKIDADTIANKLQSRGLDAEALHGDLSQHQREKILNRFKSKKSNMLVATDVAARGIDINNLSHVINYSIPQDPESYVHRIGRTGRAGKEGTAITFVTPDEYRRLIFIKRVAKSDMRKEKLPEIKDVIKSKKEKIITDITSILNDKNYDTYLHLAEEILEKNDSKDTVAALLRYTFRDELDEKAYNKIREFSSSSSVDKKGKSRLFVARGKIDKMTPAKLLKFIKDETKVSNIYLKDVKIFEKFSFITTSFEDAEVILNIFKRKKRGSRPIIERAKESRR